MLTPRRTAQLGLSAACLTLVTCITVLVAGARQDANSRSSQPASQTGLESKAVLGSAGANVQPMLLANSK